MGLPALGCQGELEPVPSPTPADLGDDVYMEAYATYAASVDPAIPFTVEYELVDTRHLDRRAGELDDWIRLVKSSQHLVPFDRDNGVVKPKFSLWGQDGYPSKEAFHDLPEDFVPAPGAEAAPLVPVTRDAGVPSYCGDGICGAYEDCNWCSYDCGSCPGQDAGVPEYCGDGICSGYEDCNWCSYDCGSCPGQDAGPVDAGVVDAGTPDGGTCSADGCCVECQECTCTDCSSSEVETSSGASASAGLAAAGAFNLLMPTDREIGDIGPASKAKLWRVTVTIGNETRVHHAMTIHHEKLVVIADDTLLAVNLYAPIVGPDGVATSRDTPITTAAAWTTNIRPDGCEQHSLVVEDPGIRETRYVTIFFVHYDDGHVRARISINIDCERSMDGAGNPICRALNCSVSTLQGSDSCDALSGWCLASTHYCGESTSAHCAKTATNDG
ncbi:MAG TPA: hypothetical protein VNM90_06130, partial [Haliangium sp.]|nr:hypothetical protein [Haliangium sp.]